MIKNYIGILVLSFVVITAIIYAFNSSGSPARVRGMKFDSQRASDITNLKNIIESYYRSNNKLPATLSEASASYFVDDSTQSPTDPETKKPYTYIPSLGNEYKLCAVFSFSNMNIPKNRQNSYSYYSEAKHPKGYYCIDGKVPFPTMPPQPPTPPEPVSPRPSLAPGSSPSSVPTVNF